MEYLTAIEISKKWGISNRMVAYYCEAGRIGGAVKRGKTWLIPVIAEKPIDKRGRKKLPQLTNSKVKGNITDKIAKADVDSIYHTSDVSNHLGFTRETLRYYEEIGLINPKRDRYSQYREFGFYDMSHLMAIDFYRKRGFSPVQIKALLKTTEPLEYENILQSQLGLLRDEIAHLQGKLIELEKAKDFYHFTTERNGEFEIKTMPSYYVEESISSITSFQEYREKVLKYLDVDNEDVLSNMVRAISFDENGYNGSGMYIVSPFLDAKKAEHLEGGKCLYTTLIADNNDDTVMDKMFTLCHKWAAEHQMSFRGIVYIFIRFVMLNEQTDKNYYEVWIPLK